MDLTAPYAPDSGQLISQTHGQRFRARATHPDWDAPVDLDVERCQVSWDERRAPRVEARLTCRVPSEQATLDALDPRTGVRVELDAGYVRPGGLDDVHTIADLGLRSRTVARPGNLLELAAKSDEALVIENRATGVVTPSQLTVATAVRDLLDHALPYSPTFRDSLPGAAPGAPVALPTGGDYWQTIDDLVDRVGGDVYDDGMRTWVLEPRASLAGLSAAQLKVGANGTIITSDVGLSREGEWANSVLLEYVFDDAGTQTTIHGLARASAGPYATTTVGARVYTERREVATSASDANAAAAAVLLRRLASGRTFRVRGVAAYWLRPGHTITLDLPTGGQERCLVVAVFFDPVAGWMDVDLRLPDNASTIATGG